MDQQTEIPSFGHPREQIRVWEQTQLPENPKNMTYRGRYAELDKETLKLVEIEKMPAGAEIRVLDFAGGVLPFGSPTAHDLVDSIEGAGMKTKVAVIDREIPADFHPNYPEVRYTTSFETLSPEFTDKQFDIVRIMHLIEHIPNEEYQKIHNQLLSRLREGGLFISTQRLDRTKEVGFDGIPDVKPLPNTIKIMQKRNGVLVPIALLPDPLVSWGMRHPLARGGKTQEEELQEYAEFKKTVEEGKQPIPMGLDEEGYKTIIDRLNSASVGLKALESDYSILSNHSDNKGDILLQLAENAKEAPAYFAKLTN